MAVLADAPRFPGLHPVDGVHCSIICGGAGAGLLGCPRCVIEGGDLTGGTEPLPVVLVDPSLSLPFINVPVPAPVPVPDLGLVLVSRDILAPTPAVAGRCSPPYTRHRPAPALDTEAAPLDDPPPTAVRVMRFSASDEGEKGTDTDIVAVATAVVVVASVDGTRTCTACACSS